MRGYFALGVEAISKPGNVGTLVRSAHAFGASFVFTLGSGLDMTQLRLVDTSDGSRHIPLYAWPSPAELVLPHGCQLVGVELTDEAIPLPSFRHPLRAAYVLGPERGSLSPELQQRCHFIVRIPTAFCVNVGVAAAVVMYDRMICLGRFAERPVRVGAPPAPLASPAHAPVAASVHGGQKTRDRARGRAWVRGGRDPYQRDPNQED